MTNVRVLAALGFVGLAGGCDLGIDENQIGTGAGGAPSTSSAGSTGPGSSASEASASTSSGSATTATTTATTTTITTTTVASTSTGMQLPQVACIGNMFNIIQCAPGQVCCVSAGGGSGHCDNDCVVSESTFECDGPEDCPMGDECCAPDERFGDVACVSSCSDDDTVCKDDGDCADSCSEEFSGPLGQAYQTCF
jgi:hypothetical protein